MASMNELKDRAAGVKSTKQVTHAMYLISASKSKKSKAMLEGSKPFFDSVKAMMAEVLVAGGSEVLESPFINNRAGPDGRTLCLLLGGDKGMAGGYNNNVIKFLRDNVDTSAADLLVAGFMGRNRAKQLGLETDGDFRFPVMSPTLGRARDITDIIVERYLKRPYKEVVIVYTTLVSALRQDPALIRLLPLHPPNFALPERSLDKLHTVLFEPSAVDVFGHLTPHYVMGVVYAAFVDAFTSEQHARMVAMDSATQSADEIIASLSLKYNRARQAQITQEITEIVGGIPT